ncbi:hypothetical protein SLS53_005908 [Cytospora paraplurivora]|uniref:Uncharacterized protein n=1 Tax=Cytospora paraplurivora TaxID=2898453 RepID=A0AAN9U6C6_9PEZI
MGRNKQNDEAMVAKVTDAVSEGHARVRRLRKLRDRVSFASSCCLSNREVVRSIRKSRKIPTGDVHTSMLSTAETIINGYIRNSRALRDAIDNTIELISCTGALHNQEESAKLDKEMRNLAEQTSRVTVKLKEINQKFANDSAIITIITILSAIYVPGGFVASIFGTNFFQFGETRHIVITQDFWKFIICWVGLTAATAVIYLLTFMHIRSRKGQMSARNRESGYWQDSEKDSEKV